MGFVVISNPYRLPVAAPASDRWLFGEENRQWRACVPIEAATADTLWAIRADPARMADVVAELGEQHLHDAMTQEIRVDDSELRSVAQRLCGVEAGLDELAACLPSTKLTRWLWIQSLRRLERLEFLHQEHAPAVLMDNEVEPLRFYLSVMVESHPVAYGAQFESKRALLQEVVNLSVAGTAHLGEHIDSFGSATVKQLEKPVGVRTLLGLAPISILDRGEFDRLLAKLREGPRDVAAHAERVRQKARGYECFLQAVTRWRVATPSTAVELQRPWHSCLRTVPYAKSRG